MNKFEKLDLTSLEYFLQDSKFLHLLARIADSAAMECTGSLTDKERAKLNDFAFIAYRYVGDPEEQAMTLTIIANDVKNWKVKHEMWRRAINTVEGIPDTSTLLNTWFAEAAEEHGDFELAEKHLRKAIEWYGKIPKRKRDHRHDPAPELIRLLEIRKQVSA